MAEIVMINKCRMHAFSSTIDESKKNLAVECQELADANETLSAKLEGTIATEFANAEEKIKVILENMSDRLKGIYNITTDFTTGMTKIDHDAERMAGGSENE